MSKRILICSDCANLLNGKLTFPDGMNELPEIDGIKVVSVQSQPSKKRKCTKCGKKINHFWTNKHWSFKLK